MVHPPEGPFTKFEFAKPLVLLPGPYRIVIYRTGKPDDKNFYRIYVNNPAVTEPAIEATRLLAQ